MAATIAFDMVASKMAQSDPSNTNGITADNFLGTSPYGLDRSILDPCQHPVYVDPSEQPCSNFFQQRGAIDFKSYIRLKKEERLAVIQFHAAVRIQAFWRGCLIRNNWKIVEAATIKIQSWIRGHLARKRVKQILAERDAEARRLLEEKSAIKIQAAVRGWLSRKNILDFKKYKSIQAKNEALRKSIARINELESALLKSLHGGGSGDLSTSSRSGSGGSRSDSKSDSNDPCADLMKREDRLSFFLGNIISPSVENFLVEKIPEYVNELSESRIAELYAYLANMESGMKQEEDLENLVKRVGGIHLLSPDQLERLEESRRIQKERANGILDLAKIVMMGPLKKKLEQDQLRREGLGRDSVDSMFPQIPDRPDVVQPNSVKVEALKDAIRMFRQKGEDKEDRDLKRKHVLLRTKAVPGVLSDIYTTELTEIEQKLKSLKFWKGSQAAEKMARREMLAKDNRLKRLFAHALKLSTKRRDEDEFDEEEEGTSTEGEALPIDYGEYMGELGPEDDDDYSDDDDYNTGSHGYYVPGASDPIPPPPTPTTVNNGEDSSANNNATTDDELARGTTGSSGI